MPITTPELGLQQGVDSDDTADYLTVSLANSLKTLDTLFSNVSGHTHTGPHQGGPVSSLPTLSDLTVTNLTTSNLTVSGGFLELGTAANGVWVGWDMTNHQFEIGPGAPAANWLVVHDNGDATVTGVLQVNSGGSAGTGLVFGHNGRTLTPIGAGIETNGDFRISGQLTVDSQVLSSAAIQTSDRFLVLSHNENALSVRNTGNSDWNTIGFDGFDSLTLHVPASRVQSASGTNNQDLMVNINGTTYRVPLKQ